MTNQPQMTYKLLDTTPGGHLPRIYTWCVGDIVGDMILLISLFSRTDL